MIFKDTLDQSEKKQTKKCRVDVSNIMIKISITRKTILELYAPDNMCSKSVKQKPSYKEEKQLHNYVKRFNTPLSVNDKRIRKEGQNT